MAYTTYIDPSFPMPEGMDPEVWTQAAIIDDTDDSVNDAELETGDIPSDQTIVDDGGDDDDTLMVPNDLIIISQALRRTPEGTTVVDVVVDVTDVPGANKYEFRLTKVYDFT